MAIEKEVPINSGMSSVTYWRVDPDTRDDDAPGGILFVVFGYTDRDARLTGKRPHHGRSFVMPVPEERAATDVTLRELYDYAKANVQPPGFFDDYKDV